MKPRLFIGSSTEGLDVANACQVNLWRSAEVTVWSQGVFKPSSITLPAILDSLESQDFGLFVFTPDDVALIRGETTGVVRDNVIFELGIFLGRLGLGRSFFLVPEGAEVRLATDLAGITPLRYETKRSDGNLVAAVAPACTEVVAEICSKGFADRAATATVGAAAAPGSAATPDVSRLSGPASVEVVVARAEAPPVEVVPAEQGDATPSVVAKETWIDALAKDNFQEMVDRLTEQLGTELNERERPELEAWRAFAAFRLDRNRGLQMLREVQEKYPQSADVFHISALTHHWHGLPEDALKAAEQGLATVQQNRGALLVAKAQALTSLLRPAEAEAALRAAVIAEPPLASAFIALADALIARKDLDGARAVLEQGAIQLPKQKDLVLKFAGLLSDHFDKKAALVFYDALVGWVEDDPVPLVRRGNLYLELQCNDLAMEDYRRADAMARGTQGWISGNIGNLYKNVGLFSLGVENLEKAVELDPKSSYAHERLATALTLRGEQRAMVRAYALEGQQSLIRRRTEHGSRAEALLDPPHAVDLPVQD